MNAFRLMKILAAGLFVAMLAACGGGGGSGNNSGFNPPGIRMSASSQSAQVAVGASVDVAVRLTDANGAPLRDGTIVSASASPSSAGTIVAVTGTGPGTTAQVGTVGGNANFRFTGAREGAVVLTFSANDPNAPARTVTASVSLTVIPGAQRLTLDVTRDTLPINTFNVRPFAGSPFMAEVTVTVRNAAGALINQTDGIQVSLNPVGNTGGFSTLDDPTTVDNPATPEIENNEFLNRLGQGTVDVVAGKASLFVHSLNFTGTSVLTVTHTDANSGQSFSVQRTFNFVSSIGTQPSTVIIDADSQQSLYAQGAGGNTTLQLEIVARDGIGQPVPNPQAGSAAFNNLRLEVIGTGGDAGNVSATNAAGQPVSGASISTRTVNGIANAIYRTGTLAGQFRIRATVDRADNNIDNGLQDGVSGELLVTVSDGKLFSLRITSPNPNAILINRVDPTVTGTAAGVVPPDPDGTYSLRISALATDRQGNPVPAGTEIEFGIVDDPLVGYPESGFGFFAISGTSGNPEEGGFRFTDPFGQFSTANFPSGPDDTLLVFGKSSLGNRDLESARTIESVLGLGSLTVRQRFNRNDDSGVLVDRGNVLPYVVGRAVDGNIGVRARTNSIGVASTTLNYPVSRLGKALFIWARAAAVDRNGAAKLVTDTSAAVYAGIAPLRLSASPNRIQANRDASVLLCASDGVGHAMPGIVIGFRFEGARGTVDGQANFGVVNEATNVDGCVVAAVSSSGVLPGATASLNFSAGGATAQVTLVPPGSAVLQASPTAFSGDGNFQINLALFDANGSPLTGVQLQGACTATGAGASLGITAPPGATDASGRTVTRVGASGFLTFDTGSTASAGATGTCTFSGPGGTPSATVAFSSINACSLLFSPPDPRCTTTTPDASARRTLTLALQAAAGTSGSGTVSSSPAGINCSLAPGSGSTTCTATYAAGAGVTLTAVPALGNSLVGWTGACVAGSNPLVATVVMNTDQACTAIFRNSTDVGTNQARLSVSLQAQTVVQLNNVPIYSAGTLATMPSGLACSVAPGVGSQECAADFVTGAVVTLIATPAVSPASTVVGWSGTCIPNPANPSQATVVMNGPQSCTLVFAPLGVVAGDISQLTVNLSDTNSDGASGTVISSPVGVSCSMASGETRAACSSPFTRNSNVQLTAAPGNNSSFVGFTGACVVQDPVGSPNVATVNMAADRTCNARFANAGTISQSFVLTMRLNVPTTADSGTIDGEVGRVLNNPTAAEGTQCVITGLNTVICTRTYRAGQRVVLQAFNGVDGTFLGWTGECQPTAGDPTIANVELTQNKTCQADFRRN